MTEKRHTTSTPDSLVEGKPLLLLVLAGVAVLAGCLVALYVLSHDDTQPAPRAPRTTFNFAESAERNLRTLEGLVVNGGTQTAITRVSTAIANDTFLMDDEVSAILLLEQAESYVVGVCPPCYDRLENTRSLLEIKQSGP